MGIRLERLYVVKVYIEDCSATDMRTTDGRQFKKVFEGKIETIGEKSYITQAPNPFYKYQGIALESAANKFEVAQNIFNELGLYLGSTKPTADQPGGLIAYTQSEFVEIR